MDRLLENKVAVVTGAGQGLGAAVAAALSVDGARVLVVSRSEEKARRTMERVADLGGSSASWVGDLRAEGSADAIVEGALAAFGRVDILVNAAGVFLWKPFFEVTPVEWGEVLDVNLKAAFLLAQSAARAMADAGRGGSVVSISSIHGIHAEPNAVPQCATKSGLIGLTRALAEALRPYDIRVNAIAPGSIAPNSADARGESPRKQVTEADVASLVVYLASDLARTITGSIIEVFGSTHAVIQV
ncbi:MAG: SDR family NAD(P)-dependent oxidoreductase [Planctomycetota bacterium]